VCAETEDAAADRLQDPIGKCPGWHQSTLGHQDHKFISAVPTDDVGSTRAFLKQPAELTEHLVARLVSVPGQFDLKTLGGELPVD